MQIHFSSSPYKKTETDKSKWQFGNQIFYSNKKKKKKPLIEMPLLFLLKLTATLHHISSLV